VISLFISYIISIGRVLFREVFFNRVVSSTVSALGWVLVIGAYIGHVLLAVKALLDPTRGVVELYYFEFVVDDDTFAD
jgi:hypothetical protein